MLRAQSMTHRHSQSTARSGRTHLISILTGLTIALSFSGVAQATRTPIKTPSQAPKINPTRPAAPTAGSLRDKPICYGVMPGNGGLLNLDLLCGVGKNKSDVIDLSVDADGDGVPDQLLAEMKKFRQAVTKAQAPEEYQRATEQLEDRMPYSASVKQLQAQQRQLQREVQRNPNPSEATYRKLSELQEKIYRDPSYQKIQEAMSKVYAKMN